MSSYQFLPYEALPVIDELPDPFIKPDGSRVSSPSEWEEQRKYLKAMLAHYLYGEMPPAPGNVSGNVVCSESALDGKAIKEKVHLTFGPDSCLFLDIEVIRPAASGQHPVLIWNIFRDSDVCPVLEELIDRGVAVIRFNKEQLGVDSYRFYEQSPCLKAYPDFSWRAIAVWAWGYSRIIDYLETAPYVDMTKIAATGYSRNGKIALCAAIYDERIALCAPGGSGCGGSGSFRFLGDRLGEGSGLQETIGSMNQMFAYWWADEIRNFGVKSDLTPEETKNLLNTDDMQSFLKKINFDSFGKVGPEFRLPFDMHFARALIAPRALITTDSMDDAWANPYGINVIWRASAEVYRFLGAEEKNAMLFREGPHAFAYTDWMAISDFIHEIFNKPVFPQRSLYITLQVPQDEERDKKNPMFPKWYFMTPHFSWRAPK